MPYHRSEEHTSELQSHDNLVCRLLLEKKKHAAATPAARETAQGVSRPRRPAPRQPARGVSRRPPACHLGAGGLPVFFFFNDTATTEIYTLSLHDALPISARAWPTNFSPGHLLGSTPGWQAEDRKSTRLNSSHTIISYAVFCLKKKKT